MGTAEIKATSFRDVVARTPTCHSFVHPGARRALLFQLAYRQGLTGSFVPFEECFRVVESEHSLIVFDVVAV